MSYINVKITGVPYSKLKSRGDFSAAARWDEAVITETRDLLGFLRLAF
jgi:hypothetical protein